jgi:purine nucleosidase
LSFCLISLEIIFMSRKFLIDTDTASDDAVALIMALRWPDVEVEAITTVAGNVPLEQCTKNALYTVELCGMTTPVYVGAARPLVREPEHADWFHGKDGLGDRGYPAAKLQPQTKHAIQAIIDVVKANPGIVIVTLGPLTNVALAVSQAPEIIPNVSRCVVMGGAACTVGNVTPAAEYNIWFDPEAAQIVFNSGLPVEMVGWEHCRGDAVLKQPEIDYLHSLKTPLADFTIDCNFTAIEAFHTQTGEIGISLPDPVTMSIALDPTICTRMTKHYVDVEIRSELTRGMTVVDQLGVAHDERNRHVWKSLLAKKPNASVAWDVDYARWKQALYSVLK